MLDRIDLQIEVAALPPAVLSQQAHASETTTVVAGRVAAAFSLQLARQGKQNQYLNNSEISQYCKLDQASERLLHDAMHRLHWSARTYYRLLRVARSIADLADSQAIRSGHVAEAIQYRRVLQEI